MPISQFHSIKHQMEINEWLELRRDSVSSQHTHETMKMNSRSSRSWNQIQFWNKIVNWWMETSKISYYRGAPSVGEMSRFNNIMLQRAMKWHFMVTALCTFHNLLRHKIAKLPCLPTRSKHAHNLFRNILFSSAAKRRGMRSDCRYDATCQGYVRC